jgi:hypothetical protein
MFHKRSKEVILTGTFGENMISIFWALISIIFSNLTRGDGGPLFLPAGGGLGYDNAGERVKQIGNQDLGGILQGGVGFCFNLGERFALRAGYRYSHVSEPFRSDKRLNSHDALLGISF